MKKALYKQGNVQCTDCTHQHDSYLEKKGNYGMVCLQCKQEVTVGYTRY